MVGQKVVLDTDIIIDHLRQEKGGNSSSRLETVVAEKNIIPLISTVTVQELFAGQSSRKIKEEQKIRMVLNLFGILPLSMSIAETAGKIIRDAETVVQLADSSIAATAISENALLLTKNKKDFQKIKGLRLYD